MKRVLYSICIGSLALALTAWGQQGSGTTTVRAKATKQGAVSAQTTTSAKTGARTSSSVAGTRFHQRANVSARARSSAMRNTPANARIRARNATMTNRSRERNIAMTERMRNQENVNVRNKTNVRVNVNDRTRFTNVTRITSNGRTFDRAVFRDRDDRRFHLGFHDRAFFVNNFSEVVFINGCSFFLDDGMFWPAFIIGENCVHPRNVVFVAVD